MTHTRTPSLTAQGSAQSYLPVETTAASDCVGGFSGAMNTDPHLIDKIGTCPAVEELDAMREAIRARGEALPDGAAYAFTERRKRLERAGA